MKITPSCTACIILKRSVELEQMYSDENNQERLSVLRELLEAMGLYIGPDIEVAELATVSFRRMKTLSPHVVKFYETLIDTVGRQARRRAERIAEIVSGKKPEEALPTLLRAAALASGYKPLPVHWRLLEEPPLEVELASVRLGIDHTENAVEYLKRIGREGGTVYYVFATVYELPYDINVVSKLREEFGIKIVGVVRSERYEDYVTLRDLDNMGYTDSLDDIVEIDGDQAVPMAEESQHVIELLNDASLVVVKNDIPTLYFKNNPLRVPILYLFTAYCPVLAKAFNVHEGSVNIVLENVHL